MSELSIGLLEQILRVRVISDDPIPDNDKGMDSVTAFAREQINEIYGKDSYYWEFSEVKRIDSRKVDVIFYYMD